MYKTNKILFTLCVILIFFHNITGYEYNGRRFFKSNMPTFYVNSSGTPDCVNEFQAIRNALDTWNAVSTTYTNFQYGGTTSNSNASSYDGTNLMIWLENNWDTHFPGSNAIAVNTQWYNTITGQMYETDISFNGENYTWSDNGSPGKYDVQNIATHELGHSISLNDLYNSDDTEKTMYGYSSSGETKKRTLDSDDINGIRYVLFEAQISGLLSEDQVWVVNLDGNTINLVGNLTIPSNRTLTIKSGVTVNLGTNKLFLTGGDVDGENEATISINGDIKFDNALYSSLEGVTVSGQIESSSGYNNKINNVTTDERILWNSSNNGVILNVTANHTDKYSLKVYNSSVIINDFESTSSSKYGIYGSSTSSLDMEALSLEEKTFAIQTTSSTSGTIYIGNFVDNDYDVWDAGSGVGYYLCFWSDNPPNLYGNVYYNPPSSQSSSSNLAEIENKGQAINKTTDNLYSDNTSDTDYNEALNIIKLIKEKKRLAVENEEKFEPSDYLADYNNAIDKFKRVVKKLNSEKLAISSQLYLYFLYQDIQQHSEFISYLESIISNSTNGNLKYRSMILLAYTQIREGEYKTATKYIDNVIQEADDEDILANSLYDNGMIFKYFLKDNNEANKYFSKLIESYPTNILVDHASDELEGNYFVNSSEKKEFVSQIKISNYPNPFNPTTQISYQIPKDGFVNLTVYNSLGQKVAVLVNRQQAQGKYTVQFNAANLSSGVYFYKITANEFNSVKKMLLVR